ncbi:MAG: EscS/YscS/HrcS family type III secretion system export apparatus protein [Candidatus Melainabacteria bacterium]|nr:MAG: EscS/YscS/HrcS family type III secretion system export apparatus protein [Candidatus Melainabacteria bacterium]RAI13673.1 MAG: EscS/YscS/HrcS family type III secretion system export apparatus protein [Candidatus Melainabacteria bacterium]
MEQDIVITLLQKMFVLILEISTPVLLVGIVVGLTVSIFQTITQIQESTLTIVPKIIAGVIALIVLMPWMMSLVIQTTNEFFDMIPGLIK